MDSSLAPSGLVVAAVGFALTRFTVTLARYEDPLRFVVAGVVPLVLGLGLAAFGVVLVVGEFDRSFVRTVTGWCLAGAAGMFVLVVLTLAGNGTERVVSEVPFLGVQRLHVHRHSLPPSVTVPRPSARIASAAFSTARTMF